jgi:two-component system NtrC family sensor kinase
MPDKPKKPRTQPFTELKLLRFLETFRRDLRAVAEYHRLWIIGLRTLMEFFGAQAGRVVFLDRTRDSVQVHPWSDGTLPAQAMVPLEACKEYIRDHNPKLPESALVAPFHLDSRIHGMILVEKKSDFSRAVREPFRRCVAILKEESERRELLRLDSLKEKLSRKLFRKLLPKDFFYQLFHGLRSLIRYDHSAALLVQTGTGQTFEIRAEQIAWKKGKSEAVGQAVGLDRRTVHYLLQTRRAVLIEDGRLEEAAPGAEAVLGDLGKLTPLARDGAPRARSLIVAPLAYEGTLPGILRIAGLHPHTFGPDHAAWLDSFLPIASAALGNLLLDERTQDRARALERETAVAGLARGVAHDVNNALGAMLPLLQQCTVDLVEGTADPRTLAEDLVVAERYARHCRKIFEGMMRCARRGRARPQPVVVNDAVKETIDLLAEDLRGRGIAVVFQPAADLPPLHLAPGALDQVLVNLISNARDATGRGGTITVLTTRTEGGDVLLEVGDTGTGIAPEHMPHLAEPFFTTKQGGNGLGLSTVRSILWDHNGKLEFHSERGKGTRVRALFPEKKAGS